MSNDFIRLLDAGYCHKDSYTSQNPNVTVDYVLTHPEINWNYGYLGLNPSTKWRDMLQFVGTRKRVYVGNQYDETLTMKDILENLTVTVNGEVIEVPWAWGHVFENPNIKLEEIINNKNSFKRDGEVIDLGSYTYRILQNPGLKWQDIQKNIRFLFPFEERDSEEEKHAISVLSQHPMVTIELLQEYPHIVNDDCGKLCWSVSGLLCNPNVTPKFVKSQWLFFGKRWRYSASYNTSFTWEYILNDITRNPDKFNSWNWSEISRRKDITWDVINNNRTFVDINGVEHTIPWYDWGVSSNPNITLEIIVNNPNPPLFEHLGCGGHNARYTGKWSFTGICKNQNMTADFVLENPKMFTKERHTDLALSTFGWKAPEWYAKYTK